MEDIRFAVDTGAYSGAVFVVAIGAERNLGNGQRGPSGKHFYNGTPQGLKHWHPFSSKVNVPQYVIDEYAARYQGNIANSTPQSALYGKLMCPDGPMDTTKIPGINYDSTRGPDPARIMK
jgi:hypothetical protein